MPAAKSTCPSKAHLNLVGMRRLAELGGESADQLKAAQTADPGEVGERDVLRKRIVERLPRACKGPRRGPRQDGRRRFLGAPLEKKADARGEPRLPLQGRRRSLQCRMKRGERPEESWIVQPCHFQVRR